MIVRVLVAAAGLWLAAILLAPLEIAARPGIRSLAAAGVYAAGAHVCHQRPDRCFRIDGRPMPVCARCTGLYAGAAIAGPLALLLAFKLSGRPAPPKPNGGGGRARLMVALAALPTAITWGTEIAGLAHPSNVVRAIAGLPLGFVAAWLVISTLSHGPRAFTKGP